MTNERVVPIVEPFPLHLHDHGAQGAEAAAAKDPTNTIYNQGGYQFGDTNFGSINPSNLFDFKSDLLIKLSLLFSDNTDNSSKLTIINQLLPDWFQFTDDFAGTHGINVLASVLLSILLENLPTSDPGGGLVWLSPT